MWGDSVGFPEADRLRKLVLASRQGYRVERRLREQGTPSEHAKRAAQQPAMTEATRRPMEVTLLGRKGLIPRGKLKRR